MNVISYGGKNKLLGQFFGDKSVIQQFSTQFNNFLQSVQIYFHVYNNKNRDYYINVLIIDSQENVYFTKKLYLGELQKSGFFRINTNLELNMNQQYYLCIDSYGQGNLNNCVGVYMGYRKKFKNFFINNNFSIGQLYCNFNFRS